MGNLTWLIVLIFIVAIALRSDLFFYILYVVVGMQMISRLWMWRSSQKLTWRRQAPVAAFPGERLNVTIEVRNTSLLPLPWVALHESLPPALHTPPMIREVLSLGAGGVHMVNYTLVASRRGYYQLGPLSLRTGDVLGLGDQAMEGKEPDRLTIYPQILSLAELGLPASLPFGTLPATRRLFSDPARPAGVRPYQAADGVRRIDWKTTAHAGTPMVRRYQPAIALETLIGLALSREEYNSRFAYDMMERSLVAAASIAAYLAAQRQPVGLCTTGHDPVSDRPSALLPIAPGRAHLMAVLGALGRLEPGQSGSLPDKIIEASAHLSWGSTIVLITGQRGDDLVAALLPLRRRGLNVALIIAEPTPSELALPQRHGIPAFGLWRDGRPRVG